MVDPTKIEIWTRSTLITDVKSFAGFARQCRSFIEGFSTIALPMTQLTHQCIPFAWSKEYELRFLRFMKFFTITPILTLPVEGKGFIVYCDASSINLGCVMMS